MAIQLKLHNQTVLGTLEEGDLVEFPRGIFSHWGVYVGDDEIVHLSGIDVAGTASDSALSNVFTISGIGFKKACAKKENFWEVVGESKAKKNNDKDKKHRPFSKSEIKERALSKLGPISYSMACDNCEHFAAWCRNGIKLSEQADTVLEATVITGAMVVAGGLLISASGDKK